MKHTILSAIAVAIMACQALTATAQNNVDQTTAKQIGAYYLSAQIGSKAVTPQALTLAYQIDNPILNIPTLYIFNLNEKGFVVVAGNKTTDPIIAHSTEGSFDPNNIPPAFQWWLNQYVQTIAYAQNNDIQPDAATLQSWQQLEQKRLPYFGSGKAITILLKSKWDQGDPYNRECPMLGNQHCLTGCVATAMAQIMHYWKYPYTAKGSVPDPIDNNNMLDFGNYFYNQRIMPDELTTDHSQEQIHAVALLNYHCGAAARMSYDTAGSGALSSRYVPLAYKNNFKYEPSLVMLDRTSSYWNNASNTPNYRDTMWLDTLKREISAKRPIFYTGRDLSSTGTHAGHAFVCDGYNSINKQLHFNWGWGGSSDCWCNVITSRLNAGGYQFQSNHNALIGLTPPADSIANQVGINPALPQDQAAPAYPNPASTQVTIPTSYQPAADNLLRLYDASGRLVAQHTIHPYTTSVTLNVSNLPAGLYIYRFNNTTNKLAVRK
ncbi:MAG: thiol protease/hemagglutinin PrtT [Bacteroidales bacterium]|nr:thiol protease/hemagglutinin PrtT [Bacteroidales bacterium]